MQYDAQRAAVFFVAIDNLIGHEAATQPSSTRPPFGWNH